VKSILVDTHAAIWYLLESKKLSLPAEQAMDAAEAIGICSISLVEIIFLTEKGRIPQVALQRLTTALEKSTSRWSVISLDTSIALALSSITREVVPEMPDRIIAATAQYLGIPLVTRDTKIQAAGIQTLW
jgi:PIN domain nuclease of toxin-antitoxin system